jgi:hypothetical protein
LGFAIDIAVERPTVTAVIPERNAVSSLAGRVFLRGDKP